VIAASDKHASAAILIPPDLQQVIDNAWQVTKQIPGYLLDNEAKFLGFLAAVTPPPAMEPF
jgi:hypothetical protein